MEGDDMVKQWTELLQAVTRGMLRHNPHLLAKPHQAWQRNSRTAEGELSGFNCRYGPGINRQHDTEAPGAGGNLS